MAMIYLDPDTNICQALLAKRLEQITTYMYWYDAHVLHTYV